MTDPAKWRIVGARADAWLMALTNAGVSAVETDVEVNWLQPPGPTITRADRATSPGPGTLPLIVAHSRLEDIDDAGVTIGVGDPALSVGWLPHCGCDACDDGSQSELDQLDAWFAGVVQGTFRLLSQGDRRIMVIDDGGWSASGRFRRREVEKSLADPAGWDEISGRSWL